MIAQNLRTKEAVLQEAIDHFSRDFRAACQSQGGLIEKSHDLYCCFQAVFSKVCPHSCEQ